MGARCRILGTVVILLVFLFGDRPGETVSRAQGTDSGCRRALLIGVNDYKSPKIADLRGAVNDTLLMRQILQSRYGFSPANIHVLHDSAATRRGILAALERLQAESGPDDTVLIQFSGHGSRVKDRDGDERDGFDETLVPHDGRTPKVADITDDELSKALAGFRAKDLIVVLDCCHSGTATRSLMVVTRSLPPDPRVELYATGGGAQVREIVPVPGARHVLFTSAASDQSAIDAPISGRHYGIFTYSLGRAVARLPEGASIRQLMAAIGREMLGLRSEIGLANLPEPQLEAPRERLDRPLFPARPGGSGAGTPAPGAARPWVTVEPRGAGSKEVTLLGAAHLGGRPGSVWAIYRPGEVEFRPGGALSRAFVVRESGDNAVAEPDPPNALVPAGARAVLVMASGSARSIPIRLVNFDDVSRSILLQALRSRVAHVAVVDGAAHARFVVEIRGNRCILLGASGTDQLASFPDSDLRAAAERIASMLGRSHAAAQLLSLDNPSSSIRLEARLVSSSSTRGVREAALGPDRGIQVVPTVRDTEYRVWREGDPRSPLNSLMIEVTVDADCYLTIVDVDSQGGVNLLFPNRHQNRAFLPRGGVGKGTTVRIPDSLRIPNRAGFAWDLSPPGGLDTIRIFATKDLETANVIRRFAADAERGGSSTRWQALAGLRQGLEKAVKVRPTGSGASGGGSGDWTATSVTLRVRE